MEQPRRERVVRGHAEARTLPPFGLGVMNALRAGTLFHDIASGLAYADLHCGEHAWDNQAASARQREEYKARTPELLAHEFGHVVLANDMDPDAYRWPPVPLWVVNIDPSVSDERVVQIVTALINSGAQRVRVVEDMSKTSPRTRAPRAPREYRSE